MTPPARKIGFVDGLRAPFEGVGFVARTPATWAWSVVPIVVVVGLTVVDFLVPPATVITTPVRFLAGAFALARDVLDYPLAMRPLSVGARIRWFSSHFAAAMGFGLALSVLFWIPVVGLVLLP